MHLKRDPQFSCVSRPYVQTFQFSSRAPQLDTDPEFLRPDNEQGGASLTIVHKQETVVINY